MKVSKFNNIKDILTVNYDYVLQIECNIGSKYDINGDNILIFNSNPKYCQYKTKEMIKEISNAGKYFLELLNNSIDFNVNFSNYIDNSSPNFNPTKLKSDKDIIGIPYGLIEHFYYISYSKKQFKQVLNYMLKWCKKYGPPCKSIETSHLVDVSNLQDIHQIFPEHIIKLSEIDKFVAKSIHIYIINQIYTLIFNIQDFIYSNLVFEIFDSSLDKNIQELNNLCNLIIENNIPISPFNWDMLTTPNDMSIKNPINILTREINYTLDTLSTIISSWHNRFSNSLCPTLIFDKTINKYKQIYTSNDITELAWNALTLTISNREPIISDLFCIECGTPLNISKHQKGRKKILCEEHKKMKATSNYRDHKKALMKKELSKYLKEAHVNPKLIREIKKMLSLSDRNFQIKKYNKLLKKLHSL